MQKCNLDVSLLKLKTQINIKRKNLLFSFSYYIMDLWFASSLSIDGYNASKYCTYFINLGWDCEDFPCLNRFICASKCSLLLPIDFPFSVS